MPIIPCCTTPDTCQDLPLSNYTSEAADVDRFFARWYGSLNCTGFASSTISQSHADMLAQQQWADCEYDGEEVCSDEQRCEFPCEEGSYTFVVPAGSFCAETKEEANALALSVACRGARETYVCLSDFSGSECCCKNQEFSNGITATGSYGTNPTWSIVSGSLPPGVSSSSSGPSFSLAGTPTASGNFTFTLRIETAAGSYTERDYTVKVLEIVTSSLPNYEVGTAYSEQLTANGGSGNYSWSYIGVLPTGLTLSETGLLSGTPTASSGDVAIVFVVTDTECP